MTEHGEIVDVEIVAFDYDSVEPQYRAMIESRTAAIKEQMRRTAQAIVEVGNMLNEVKECLPHGQFTLWLQIEFNWDVRKAQNFMAVAKMFKSASGHVFPEDLLSKVSIDQSALYILAAKSTPQAIRQEVLERAYLGEPFTKSKVKQIVAKSKIKQSTATTKIQQKTKPDASTTESAISFTIGQWVRVTTLTGNKDWDRLIGQVVTKPEFGKYGVKLNETNWKCLRFFPDKLIPIPYRGRR